jgi:predicted phosphoribosyltransferase
MIFKDRTEAGKILARKISPTLNILMEEKAIKPKEVFIKKKKKLVKHILEEKVEEETEEELEDRLGKEEVEKIRKNIIVLAIPNGGVAVGYEVSKSLDIDFDVIVCRKVQIPWNPEAGYGSVAPDGSCFLNKKLVLALGLSDRIIKQNIQKTINQIKERIEKYRGKKPFPELKDKIVILVDDGLASGFTMLASIEFVKKKKPKKIIVAVPTASGSAYQLVKSEIDKLIALDVRYAHPFAVADAYENWYDVTDEEVLEYLKK